MFHQSVTVPSAFAQVRPERWDVMDGNGSTDVDNHATCRVAIVEDDRSLRETLAAVLAHQHHDVRAFETAEAFLSEAEMLDVVILDVGLPGMNGVACCAELRRRGFDGPMLMLTARHEVPDRVGGMFALETAMDELAVETGIDPVELRIRNEPDVDPASGKPFSTRNLVACLLQGADRFGWRDRMAPAQRRDGEWLIGLGVASATFPNAHLVPSRAGISFEAGRYVIEMQGSDVGTGAATVLPQIAAKALGVPVDSVEARIGRSDAPIATIAGGSAGTYEWGSAIMAAAEKFLAKHGDNPKDGAGVKATGLLPRGARDYSRHAFGATFCQVRVSEVTGEVGVDRMLGMYAAGTIINPRTARSQFIGGMTMGISAALHEEAYLDPRFGHVVNGDLAGYHIASHADIKNIEAAWVDEFDPWFGSTGAKGIGEIGIVGVPAAVGNAIFNATGARLRDLPFTPDKLITAMEESAASA